jgi:glutamyl-tRNA synthetase
MTVVTRFAPSPTGYLHIGGTRTALFNLLYARRHSGRYLLRIEDTDRVRSTDAAVAAIIDGLTWLGLGSDEPILYQFARAARHREAAEAMVERGTAFRCYVTPEELQARRDEGAAAREALGALKRENASADVIAGAQARSEALNRAFRSPYRDGRKPPSPTAPFVIRLRAPDAGDVVNDDMVQGTVRVGAREIDDLVLLRADGTPTYMLAVVVDDHDMGVTHVIRGDDHLSNAARQIPIFDAMGWARPVFAHVPMIHGPDGAKLSKRHGAQAVHEFRDMGFLPEAVTNYLARLGWAHGDWEKFTLDEAAAVFGFDGMGKAPARLDFDKLKHLNGAYMQDADDSRLMALVEAHWRSQALTPVPAATRARVLGAVGVLKGRAKTIIELAEAAAYLTVTRPLSLDAKALASIKDETRALVARLRARLAAVPEWTADQLGGDIKAFATEEGVGLGQFGPSLRAILTGGRPSPDLGFLLASLGRDEALARIDDQLGPPTRGA